MELILFLILIIWFGNSISKAAKQRPAPRPRPILDPSDRKVVIVISTSAVFIIIPNEMFPVYIKIIIICGIILALPPRGIVNRIRKQFESPFEYPYYTHQFDVTGKRNPNIDDCLDTFLINGGFKEIQEHQEVIEEWKSNCEHRLSKSFFYSYRRKQYEEALDDESAFEFTLVRSQTQYRQNDYVKSAYKTYVEIESLEYCYDYIENRYWQLKKIGFECTLREYHSKHQRRLTTRDLRESIMIRDNYTCQICGKYMPDEVGLQIDHIIPVSKGGKSVPSNLRVLCSKCNSAKSAKIEN